MKKILLFIDVLGSGGAQRQLVSLARLLKETGKYQISVVDYYDNSFFDEELKHSGINYKHYPTKGKLNIIKLFRQVVKESAPDLIISYLEHPSIIACVVKLLSRNKFHLIVSERNTTQKNNLNIWLRFQLFRLADFVVPNSYSQKQFIEKNYNFLTNKTFTIHNYIDTSRFKPRLNRKLDAKRGLVVGRVVEQKNVLKVLEAFNILKDRGVVVHFDWYGKPHPESYYKQCKDYIQKNKIHEYITFYPPTSQIENKYSEASFFMLPSIYEGFPNVLCEAMSAGLPVLASDVCDNSIIVSEEVNGFLFNPNSANEIADKIQTMIMLNEAQYSMMAQKSREIALEKFSKEKFIQHYLRLIETLE